MASNRAIMPRAAVASQQLPDDVEGHVGHRAAAATARFCCGSRPISQWEMAFNSYTGSAVWASKVVRGTKSVAGMLKFPGVNDPYELERWKPNLKLIREILLTRDKVTRLG